MPFVMKKLDVFLPYQKKTRKVSPKQIFVKENMENQD